jgi:predicted  nucleic acid-binding Zn-ribbon protein
MATEGTETTLSEDLDEDEIAVRNAQKLERLLSSGADPKARLASLADSFDGLEHQLVEAKKKKRDQTEQRLRQLGAALTDAENSLAVEARRRKETLKALESVRFLCDACNSAFLKRCLNLN